MRFGITSSRFRLAHNDEHDKEIKATFAPRVSSDVALGPPLELPPGNRGLKQIHLHRKVRGIATVQNESLELPPPDSRHRIRADRGSAIPWRVRSGQFPIASAR